MSYIQFLFIYLSMVGHNFFAVAIENNAAWRENFFAFFGNFLSPERPGIVDNLHVEKADEVDTHHQNDEAENDISARV